jgi:hypothetical protein
MSNKRTRKKQVISHIEKRLILKVKKDLKQQATQNELLM